MNPVSGRGLASFGAAFLFSVVVVTAGTAPQGRPSVALGDGPWIYDTYEAGGTRMGHRNQIGLAFHPETGDLWASENGPQGGDEVNILVEGANYGWPVVTYGRNYDGTPAADRSWRPEFTAPELVWVPSIATSGMTFYDGEAIPSWQGNLFVGAMVEARIPLTGHLQRIVFNENGETRRESLLRELRQRIRDVRQGPDGLLYLLTDEDDGAVLKIEPAPDR